MFIIPRDNCAPNVKDWKPGQVISNELKPGRWAGITVKLAATETELSKNIFERGVDNKGFALIRSKGDSALFGGYNTSAMKRKLDITENRPLADFLPTITITAKQLATEITNFNVKKNDLIGERKITTEHVKNNQDVRTLLGKSGIKPEELPAEEDIKKLERRVKSADKNIVKKNLKGK